MNGHAWSGTHKQVCHPLSVLGESFTKYGILHSNKDLLCGGIMRCFKRNVRCFEVQPERRSGMLPLIQYIYLCAQSKVEFYYVGLCNFRTSIGALFKPHTSSSFNLVANELTLKTDVSNVPNMVVEYCFLFNKI